MFIIIWWVKTLTRFLRIFHVGGGTSLPGLIIEKFFPSLITRLAGQYSKIILITGTNGKTTTQKLLRFVLEKDGCKVVSNTSGANLLRGVAVSIVNDCSLAGHVRSDTAIFEVEEATMPILAKLISAHIIIVTNLYRDQLDAYGEIIKTRSYIINAIRLIPQALLVLLGDDPNVSSIASEVPNKAYLFSIRDTRINGILYERKVFKYKGRANIRKVYAKYIRTESDLSTHFNIYGLKGVIRDIHFKSPGLHYIYNAIAAIIAASKTKRISSTKLALYVSHFPPAFGRGEVVRINDKQIRILLIKNPASLTANLLMLRNINNLKLFILINDKIADGTDVSWLWDSKVELLRESVIASITLSGRRAYDMQLRLKYAEIHPMHKALDLDTSRALDTALGNLGNNEVLYILPTYTAMLEVRALLGNIVKLKPFWE